MIGKVLCFLVLLSISHSQIAYNMKVTYDKVIEYKRQWQQDYLQCDRSVKFCRVKISKTGFLSSITTSESQSFGMLIFSFMTQATKGDEKKYYDALLRFSESRPSKNDVSLFNSSTTNDTLSSNHTNFMSWYYHESYPDEVHHSSFSADADKAYSLFLANSLYTSKENVNYLEKFKFLLSKLEGLISRDTYCPYLGDWVMDNNDINNEMKFIIKPSSFLFANFLRFNSVSSIDFGLIIERQLVILLEFQMDYIENTSKLLPDYLLFMAESQKFVLLEKEDVIEKKERSYYVNSCTLPFRIVNYLNKFKSKTGLKVLFNIVNFFMTSYSVDSIPLAISLDGKVSETTDEESSMRNGCLASLMTAFIIDYDELFNKNKEDLLNFKENQKKYLIALESIVEDKHVGYYSDTLTLLSMIVMLKRL